MQDDDVAKALDLVGDDATCPAFDLGSQERSEGPSVRVAT